MPKQSFITHALPELLAPSGNMAQLDANLLYGADAVYLGGTGLNLRASSAGFSEEALAVALAKVHSKGAKLYYCLNALPHQKHLPAVHAALERLAEPFYDENGNAHSPDGLIIADLGVFRLAQRLAPNIPIHVSTQANTANAESAGFWRDLGAARVNLARELPRADIRDIMRAVPELEYECFVHGAMCLAISGRCLLSAWMNNRPANLGQCTHPCRFQYNGAGLELHGDENTMPQEINPDMLTLSVDEMTRPDVPAWRITECDDRSQIWSPHDQALVPYMHWFWAKGVRTLKIEGRMKTAGYAAQVVDVYRTALDDMKNGVFRPALYMAALCNTASRPLTSGFFLNAERRKTSFPTPEVERFPIVATVEKQLADDMWELSIRSRWDTTRPMQIMLPGLRRPVLSAEEYSVENHKGQSADMVHSGTRALLRCDDTRLAAGLFLQAAE